jgi:hypothetical protein
MRYSIEQNGQVTALLGLMMRTYFKTRLFWHSERREGHK